MTILAGAKILADDILALQGRLPIRARSTTATTWISDIVFKDITGLSCAVGANQVYKVRGRLKITGANTTHDVQVQWTLPALATVEWSLYAMTASQTSNPVSVDMSSNSGAITRGTIGGTMTYLIDGIITTGANAGTAQLQGRQSVSDPGTLSIDAGSEISLQLWV